jgi:hypothetical protein
VGWRSSFLLTSDATGTVFEAFVFEPSDVEVEYVALNEILGGQATLRLYLSIVGEKRKSLFNGGDGVSKQLITSLDVSTHL